MTGRTAAVALAIAAVLATGGTGRAGTIVYDLTASLEQVRLPENLVGPQGYFEAPLATGSTLTLEVEPSGVTIAASRFLVQHTISLGALGSITTDTVGELTGGLGSLNDGLGVPLVSWVVPASYSVSGTFECFGAICADGGWAEDVPLPYEDLLRWGGIEVQSSLGLGLWVAYSSAPFDPYGADRSAQLAAWSGLGMPASSAPPANSGILGAYSDLYTALDSTGQWSTLLRLRGYTVPEPAPLASLCAALLLLALGRGASGTMRRHEAD